jgi:uncharacterized protein (UPF0303 family)
VSNQTTGNFQSAELAHAEQVLRFSAFEIADAITLGKIAAEIGLERNLPIAIEVRMQLPEGDWTVVHLSLPGSKPENDNWIARKARVVRLTGHSTMHQRVAAEERGVDWYAEHGVSERDYAVHGGGLPIMLALSASESAMVATLIISGLPQVQDHLLGIEILTEFLARAGEQF